MSKIGDVIENIFYTIQRIFIMDGQQPIIAVIFIRTGKWIKVQYMEAYVDGVRIYLNNKVWEDCVFCKLWNENHLCEISDEHQIKEYGSREPLQLLQDNLDVKVHTY